MNIFIYFLLQISSDQVVLSHSPLRILSALHDKQVVVCGQGPVSDIAKMYSFFLILFTSQLFYHHNYNFFACNLKQVLSYNKHENEVT